jgi:hypothetical protein
MDVRPATESDIRRIEVAIKSNNVENFRFQFYENSIERNSVYTYYNDEDLLRIKTFAERHARSLEKEKNKSRLLRFMKGCNCLAIAFMTSFLCHNEEIRPYVNRDVLAPFGGVAFAVGVNFIKDGIMNTELKIAKKINTIIDDYVAEKHLNLSENHDNLY